MRNSALISMILVIVTLVVYWQVRQHEFINLDDDFYVTNNPHVTSGLTGGNVVWAFTSDDVSYWHPITWLTHMADVDVYGINPGGHHFTNVVIHIISSLLLLLLLFRLTGALWQSTFVAALFALHPLHVESVAWVAERKDVLSALFGFLSLLFYLEYAKSRRSAGEGVVKQWKFYFFALIFFIFGLMSKPMIVTLPFIMLLLDFWLEYRFVNLTEDMNAPGEIPPSFCHERGITGIVPLLVEKTPFFVCSLCSGIFTIYAQQKLGAIVDGNNIPLLLRVENTLVAYVKYMGKTLWPHDLALLYSLPMSLPLWQVMGSLVILLLVSTATIKSGRRFPFLFFGWFWFLITLVPVIGLIQVGGAQYMADRYSYISIVGLFIMAGYGVPLLLKKLKYRHKVLAILFCLVITASSLATWRQLGYWRDGISLFQRTLDVTPPPLDNYRTHYLLGNAFASKGYLDAAIIEYKASLRLNLTFPEANNNLAAVLEKRGYLDEAIKAQEVILAMDPNNAGAHNSLGFIFFKKGELDKAIRKYSDALTLNPNFVDAHNNMGLTLAAKGYMDAAVEEYKRALRINPNHANSHYNLGVALASQGNLDAAIFEYQETLRINPNDIDAYNNLSSAVAAKKLDNAGK